MGNAIRTGPRRARLALAGAFAAVLAVGVGLGVLLDRSWLRPPVEAAGQDPRLIGRWAADDDRSPLEFKSDGTFEYVRVTKAEVPAFGPRPGDVGIKQETLEDRVTGQYRWVTAESVEVREPDLGGHWAAVRFVIDGDRLTLLRPDGSVRRYTRGP